ncbi:MAG: hypothetical protein EZS28_039985, partial [Streblomastix strix]
MHLLFERTYHSAASTETYLTWSFVWIRVCQLKIKFSSWTSFYRVQCGPVLMSPKNYVNRVSILPAIDSFIFLQIENASGLTAYFT